MPHAFSPDWTPPTGVDPKLGPLERLTCPPNRHPERATRLSADWLPTRPGTHIPYFPAIEGFTLLGVGEFACPNDVEGERRFALPVYRCHAFVEALLRAKKLDDEPTEIFVPGVENPRAAVDCEFVLLPPPGHDGWFTMGDREYFPRETVEMQIARLFLIARTAVTQRVYRAIKGKRDPFKWPGDMQPANGVTWNDIMQATRGFCARSQQAGTQLRLPSEAEWEFACRGGTQTLSHLGNVLESHTIGGIRDHTADVATVSMNAYGLFEMHHNLHEWCADPWYESLDYLARDGTVRDIPRASQRALRTGAWSSLPIDRRSGNRDRASPNWQSLTVGFRPARTVPD